MSMKMKAKYSKIEIKMSMIKCFKFNVILLTRKICIFIVEKDIIYFIDFKMLIKTPLFLAAGDSRG